MTTNIYIPHVYSSAKGDDIAEYVEKHFGKVDKVLMKSHVRPDGMKYQSVVVVMRSWTDDETKELLEKGSRKRVVAGKNSKGRDIIWYLLKSDDTKVRKANVTTVSRPVAVAEVNAELLSRIEELTARLAALEGK
jgi:hypothetical protein